MDDAVKTTDLVAIASEINGDYFEGEIEVISSNIENDRGETTLLLYKKNDPAIAFNFQHEGEFSFSLPLQMRGIVVTDKSILIENEQGNLVAIEVKRNDEKYLYASYNPAEVLSGYGLSKYNLDFKSYKDFKNNRQTAKVLSDCTSGGEGSSSCSIDEPFNSCSVTCREGYYACCDSSTTTCTCVESGDGAPMK
ncbi:MAG: hypothetical protein R3345_02175 [Fulvivirga sp.]|nr:hypothetical protein [Fulvivirga sp.]